MSMSRQATNVGCAAFVVVGWAFESQSGLRMSTSQSPKRIPDYLGYGVFLTFERRLV